MWHVFHSSSVPSWLYQRHFEWFSLVHQNAGGETKVYKKNKLSGCERICGASLVFFIADKGCLVWSGLNVLILSVSIFPGWMARHRPPDDCLWEGSQVWWHSSADERFRRMLHLEESQLLKINETSFRDFKCVFLPAVTPVKWPLFYQQSSSSLL